MSNSILKELLTEYEQKRVRKENDFITKKALLFSKHPELQDLEDNINTLCFSKAKLILSSGKQDLEDLKEKIEILNKKKLQLLDQLGIAPSDLEVNYDCSDCKDTGYISNNYSTVMCHCLKQKLFNKEYNKSNISNLNKENFKTFNFNLYSDEVDEKKYNSNISPRENMKIIYNIANKFIDNFDNSEQKNLLFTGNTGLGKTFLSNCIASSLLEKGNTVLYQTAPVMLDSIIDYRFNKQNISSDFYHQLLDVDLLIIDDLGTETINNLKFTELFNILNTRLLNQNKKVTKTIISTNLTLQNMFSTYDERIVSRIVGYYDICRFFGNDIRFKKN